MIQTGYKPAQQVQPNNFFQLPFNELYAGLANKQRYYDLASSKADNAANGMEGLMKSVDVWDTGAAYQRVSKFQANVDALKEKYPDYTDPMFTRELNKIIREGSSDAWWGKAIASKPIYEQWRKAYGESDAPLQNKAEAISLIEKAATAPGGATELFQGNVSPLNIPKYSDWGKTLGEIGKGVKADGNEKVNIGGQWITSEEWEGITQEKMLSSLGINYKKDAQGNYIDASGKPITDLKAQSPVLDYDNMAITLGAEDMRQLQLDAKALADSNNMDYATAMKALYAEKAFQVANANTYSKTKQDVSDNPYGLEGYKQANRIALKAMDKEEENMTTLDQLVYGNKAYDSLPEKLGGYGSSDQKLIDIYNNPNSSKKERERAKRVLESNGVTPTGVQYPSETSQSGLMEYASKLKNTDNPSDVIMGEVMETLINENPQRAGETNADYNNRLNKGYVAFKETYKNTELSYGQYEDAKKIKDETAKVIGTTSGTGDNKIASVGLVANKGIILLDEETGSSKIMSFEDFTDDVLNVNPADFVNGSKVTGKAEAVNDFSPTGYVSTFTDKQGKVHNFIITQTDYRNAKKNEPVYTLSQPMFNPLMKTSQDVPAVSLNLSSDGLKYLELAPNQTLIMKRVDGFNKTTYAPKMEIYKRTWNGNTYSEEPYTIQGTEIDYNSFIDLYNTIVR